MILANAAAMAGRVGEALMELERAYNERHDELGLTLSVDPSLDILRPEPRFQALVRKMNFPPGGGEKKNRI